jgi:hypothetical protein
MIVRALPATLAEDLNDFAERVSELLLHPLVRETPLRASNPLAIMLYRHRPVTRVNQRDLFDLLRIIRLFETQSEPTNARKIVDRLLCESIEATLRSGAQCFLDAFSLDRLPNCITIRRPDGSLISPKIALDLYLNGDKFHGNRKKRKKWKELTFSRMEPVFYNALLHAAIAKANAVIKFYRLLRVHRHVQSVPGDPTHA